MKPIPKQVSNGFKTGVNKLEQVQITKMNEAGKDAYEISLILKVQLNIVESFIPKKKKKAKAKKEG